MWLELQLVIIFFIDVFADFFSQLNFKTFRKVYSFPNAQHKIKLATFFNEQFKYIPIADS